jgi:predicted Zn-dependent peptidase
VFDLSREISMLVHHKVSLSKAGCSFSTLPLPTPRPIPRPPVLWVQASVSVRRVLLIFQLSIIISKMPEHFDKCVLKNGMVLLGERMEGVESAAFEFMLPAGAAMLPEGCCGAANVISDLVFRGAGERNNRQLGDELDGLGLHRSSAVTSSHITLGSSLESSNLEKALDLYADIILRPQLADEQFESARQLVIDDIKALDDDPKQMVLIKVRELFYPKPLGTSTFGDIEQLKNLTAEKTRQLVKKYFNLSQTIFAIAGKFNFSKIAEKLEKLFESGSIKKQTKPRIKAVDRKYTHIHNDGAQVHIGLMTPTVTCEDENYYNARLAISILSGGMSARLFTEVREKRGLCYAIGARYHNLKEYAGIMCYAGTTPEKAQETIEIIIREFNRLSEGVTIDELDRAKAGLKSALILQSESTASRAGSLDSDYFLLGRIRSLDEIKQKIDATSVDSVTDFLRQHPFKEYIIVSIGPKEIKVS